MQCCEHSWPVGTTREAGLPTVGNLMPLPHLPIALLEAASEALKEKNCRKEMHYGRKELHYGRKELHYGRKESVDVRDIS